MILFLFACELTDIENPTGTCEPDDDGGRVCYHAPGADSQYLPHCDAPLEREYWRVFAMEDDTGVSAYMIPRPDGSTPLAELCAAGGHAELLDRYTLCDASVDVDLVNAMDPADALDIGFALHQQLVFTAVDYGEGMAGVDPWAPPDDVLAICEAGADAGLEAVCDFHWSNYDGEFCNDIAMTPTLEEAELLAEAMNALYGITVE